ncbi:hypothetical protein GOB86_09555 [Acetobacter lambici]|uniref:Uncharacterized protein n=1 Tax=Acetobacter lambici TaxID=1332824 RepID=A0ABT1F1C0_9PROT|nr:hypothetical protein [Acetobacter lambici]MCP1242847.1 hypothetical protein [Acetobacter lambici]MCP1258994.1 hypothetical protein [Acetobacter lambici]NHO57301.1 hypothetical protein [Acetobacter lambici]
MAKVNSHANSMSIGNTHTKPYRLFEGIVGRSDVAEYRNIAYSDLMQAGVQGIKDIHLGIETVRKGWLQTVAVCVVLMDRQFEAAIRTALIEHQSDQFKNSLKKKADRPLDPAHITIALNAVLKKGSSQEITGSAKTRLNKAVEYIQKLGYTLDERLARLDEFQSFNELQKAIKGDVAGAVNVSQEAINIVDATAKFKERASSYFAKTDNVFATFKVDPLSQPVSKEGFYVALCRAKGDTLEVVGLNRQPEIISAVINTAAAKDSLLKSQIAAEDAEMASEREMV